MRIPRVFSFPRGGFASWLGFSRSSARAERGDRGGRGGGRRRVRRASRVRTTSAQHDACSRASPRPRVAISADAASSGTSREACEAFPKFRADADRAPIIIGPRPSDGRTSTARVETGPGAKSVERRSRIRVLIDTSRRSKKYLPTDASRISALIISASARRRPCARDGSQLDAMQMRPNFFVAVGSSYTRRTPSPWPRRLSSSSEPRGGADSVTVVADPSPRKIRSPTFLVSSPAAAAASDSTTTETETETETARVDADRYHAGFGFDFDFDFASCLCSRSCSCSCSCSFSRSCSCSCSCSCSFSRSCSCSCSDPRDRDRGRDRGCRPWKGSGGGDPLRNRRAPRDLEDSAFDATERPFDRPGSYPDRGLGHGRGPNLVFSSSDFATHPLGSTRRADATDRLSPRRRAVLVLARACGSGGDRRRRGRLHLVRGARGGARLWRRRRG